MTPERMPIGVTKVLWLAEPIALVRWPFSWLASRADPSTDWMNGVADADNALASQRPLVLTDAHTWEVEIVSLMRVYVIVAARTGRCSAARVVRGEARAVSRRCLRPARVTEDHESQRAGDQQSHCRWLRQHAHAPMREAPPVASQKRVRSTELMRPKTSTVTVLPAGCSPSSFARMLPSEGWFVNHR